MYFRHLYIIPSMSMNKFKKGIKKNKGASSFSILHFCGMFVFQVYRHATSSRWRLLTLIAYWYHVRSRVGNIKHDHAGSLTVFINFSVVTRLKTSEVHSWSGKWLPTQAIRTQVGQIPFLPEQIKEQEILAPLQCTLCWDTSQYWPSKPTL